MVNEETSVATICALIFREPLGDHENGSALGVNLRPNFRLFPA